MSNLTKYVIILIVILLIFIGLVFYTLSYFNPNTHHFTLWTDSERKVFFYSLCACFILSLALADKIYNNNKK